MCVCVCVPVHACVFVCGLATAAVLPSLSGAVYGSHSTSSSCSSVSHVIVWPAVIGWERSRRGGRAGLDDQREGTAMKEGRRGGGGGRKRDV